MNEYHVINQHFDYQYHQEESIEDLIKREIFCNLM